MRWPTSTWPLPSAWMSSEDARNTPWGQTLSTLGLRSKCFFYLDKRPWLTLLLTDMATARSPQRLTLQSWRCSERHWSPWAMMFTFWTSGTGRTLTRWEILFSNISSIKILELYLTWHPQKNSQGIIKKILLNIIQSPDAKLVAPFYCCAEIIGFKDCWGPKWLSGFRESWKAR